MDFTVIICTYNRKDNLEPCLEKLSQQQGMDGIDWEVLVVDNNSDDGTAEEIQRLANKLPITINYASETEQGLNYARNTGIRESKGRFFSYVDDDIIVSETWLSSIYETFINNDADAVGGRIHLDPSIELPRWVYSNPELQGFLGFQDLGEEPIRLDGRKNYPYGGNMAFNRRVVEKIGYFNPKLGRKGSGRKRSELFKGAETDYFHRLAAAGDAHIFYDPRAIVYHRVEAFQLEKKYFLTIHYNAGYQEAAHKIEEYGRSLLGVPLFIYPQMARAIYRYIILTITKGANFSFRQKMTVAHFLGVFNGYRNKKQ